MNELKKMVVMAVCLAAMPLVAQGQPLKMVQRLDGLRVYRSLVVEAWSRSNVQVVQDTADYVEFTLYNAADTATLPDGIIQVKPSDFGSGNLYIKGFPTVLGVELHLQTRSLYLIAGGYSDVTLAARRMGDSLVYDQLTLQADMQGMLVANSHIHAAGIALHASDNGVVYCQSYTSPKYYEEQHRGGVIGVGMRNGERDKNATDSWQVRGNTHLATASYRPVDRMHLGLMAAFHNWGTSSLNGLSGTEYIFDYRTGYYWERNAWEDAASAHTDLGNVQVELSYDVVAREHFAIGLGLGYERDVYRMRHPFVSYVEREDIPVNTDRMSTTLYSYTGFSILPEPGPIYWGRKPLAGGWSSRLETNYLTLPLHFTYYVDRRHRKGFHAGVAVIPGMALSSGRLIRHYDAFGGREVVDQPVATGDTVWGAVRYDIHDVQEVKVNPKLDVRLTLGWANWSAFLQLSTIPLLRSEETLGLYPMKLGARIQL